MDWGLLRARGAGAQTPPSNERHDDEGGIGVEEEIERAQK